MTTLQQRRKTIEKREVNPMHTLILSFVFLFCLPLSGFAHGTDKHVMGTTIEVAADHLKVRATDGHEVRVAVGPHTKFLKDRSPATAADLKSGSRVVVELEGKGEHAVAAEVHFGSGTAAAPGVPVGADTVPQGHPKD